jgi:peptidoglycan hydrolase CwlO-like protein
MDLKAWAGEALTIVQLVGVVVSMGFAVLVLRLRSVFATVVRLESLAAQIDQHDTRLTRIEATVPDVGKVEEILRKLEELNGNQKALQAELNGVRKAEERTEERLGRIEEHLLRS